MKEDRYDRIANRPALRRSMVLITTSGSLCMIFIGILMSPARTDFYMAVGASEIHFGFLAGIPLFMLGMQFLGAFAVNRVVSRKWIWMTATIICRLMYIPAVFLPLIFPHADINLVLTAVIVIVGLSSAGQNLFVPWWFSWMADLLPSRALNTYWGIREFWMQITSLVTAGLLVFFLMFPKPVTELYPFLALVAVLAGVIDIMLFAGVREPPNLAVKGRSVWNLFKEPWQHREFRTFLLFYCTWSAVALFAASFMQLYALQGLRMTRWQAQIVWALIPVGWALSARTWGRLADRHGQRPILVFCMIFKPVIVIIFMFLTPASALYVLPIAFCMDSIWNSGLMVAQNGYMMKMAPRENRSMFIAAVTGMSGIAGGVGAILGGLFLYWLRDFSVEFGGRTWGNFHLLFAVAFLMRVGCAILVHRVREPKSSRAVQFTSDVFGGWPMRFLRFPVAVYRRARDRKSRDS